MRFIVILAVMLAAFSGPAWAQTAPNASRESHLHLAERYLELTQGGDLLKQFRSQIEDGFDVAELPADQRTWMVDSLTAIFTDVMGTVMTEMRDDVADSFTVPELEAAIAFYQSPIGRSVVRKQVTLSMEMQQTMMPLLVPRMTELSEKFCVRFDCTALADAAGKSSR
jgi:hypothetical protein